MRIEQTNLTKTTGHIQNSAKTTRPAPTAEAADFELTNRLNATLTNTPETRADKVARAKELLADPTYPSQEQLGGVADVLANEWSKPSA